MAPVVDMAEVATGEGEVAAMEEAVMATVGAMEMEVDMDMVVAMEEEAVMETEEEAMGVEAVAIIEHQATTLEAAGPQQTQKLCSWVTLV